MEIPMKHLFTVASLVLFLMSTAFAEEGNISKYQSQTSVQITMENDNPFLNLMPDLFYVDDDYGYTHGLGIDVEIIPENGIFAEGERWKINLNTELYTRDITPEGEDLFPTPPQKFNEMTKLDISWDNVLESQDKGTVYYLIGGGVGRINDSDDSGWAGVGQQRRWHVYKHNNLTPESTAMYDNEFGDTNKTFITAKAGIGKIVRLSGRTNGCQCEINRVRVEAGTELVSIKKGSKAYLFVGVDKSLVQYGNHSIGAEFNNTANIHASGDKEIKTYGGVYYKSKSFTIKTGFTKQTGDQNNDFYKYTDDDNIWSLEIRKDFR